MLTVEFVTDPAEFLKLAGEYLCARPVEANVVASIAARAAVHGPGDVPHFWFAIVRDGNDVVGSAMRTAPFAPYPLFVCPMPAAGAVLLARLLHERGEHPGGANGALPAARTIADETARLWGGSVEVAMATRLYELDELVAPTGVGGRPRPATYDDAALCLEWYRDFDRAAREQAGNAATSQGAGHETLDSIRQRIDDGRILLWEAPDGAVAHLTGFTQPSFGVARIGPVYTPYAHRGRGYASAAVAEASRRLVAQGARVCLFTDQDNPVSNPMYQRLGYRPVVDMANHTVT
jgi:RimJ/RimL family protein N-acetyltransferase